MLIDLIMKNRSYRGYDHSRKISRDELVDMVNHARFSASSVNQQPIRFCLAYEEEQVDKIQAQTGWAKGLPDVTLPREGKCPTAFIVLCLDTSINDNRSTFLRDAGIYAQSILLRAVEMGLGGCMIGNFHAGNVKEILELPEKLSPLLVVAIGKPDEEIVLEEIEKDGSTKYYRDENDVHYVPKRKLEDLIIG